MTAFYINREAFETWRFAANLSRAEVAAQIGVSLGALQSWLSSRRGVRPAHRREVERVTGLAHNVLWTRRIRPMGETTTFIIGGSHV